MWEGLPLHLREDTLKYLLTHKQLTESHARCEKAGLSRNIDRLRETLTGESLSAFIQNHASLIAQSRNLFADTLQQIPEKAFVFILADHEARIIDIFAPPEILEHCWRRGLRAGASLQEEICGTNAVALALRYHQPVVVQGEQHYCRLFSDWLCAASPVLSATGEPIACVDVSTTINAPLGLLLPVATLLAMAIEGWLIDPSRQPTIGPKFPACVDTREVLRNRGYLNLTAQESSVAYLRMAENADPSRTVGLDVITALAQQRTR